MNAGLGSTSSYTWRAIWEARCVLNRGMRGRVGDGEKIKVWLDNWIPGSQSRKVLSPRGEANIEREVGTLIHSISRSWSEALLSQLFLPFEVERILSTPLSHQIS